MEIQTRTRGFAGNRVSVVSAVAANVAGDVIEFALGSPPLLNGEPAGNRIYINDAGNDAIRYLTYNP